MDEEQTYPRLVVAAAAPSDAGGDELADLFEGPQEEDNDIRTDDLLEVEEEDVMGGDVNSALEVTQEDILVGERKPKSRPPPKLVRTSKPLPRGLIGLR